MVRISILKVEETVLISHYQPQQVTIYTKRIEPLPYLFHSQGPVMGVTYHIRHHTLQIITNFFYLKVENTDSCLFQFNMISTAFAGLILTGSKGVPLITISPLIFTYIHHFTTQKIPNHQIYPHCTKLIYQKKMTTRTLCKDIRY